MMKHKLRLIEKNNLIRNRSINNNLENGLFYDGEIIKFLENSAQRERERQRQRETERGKKKKVGMRNNTFKLSGWRKRRKRTSEMEGSCVRW